MDDAYLKTSPTEQRLLKWLGYAVSVKPSELRSLVWSFLWFFFVLAAFYTVRPIREMYATRVGQEQVRQLFFATLVCMLLASPLYNGLVDRVSRAKLVPISYRFFSVWLVGFAAASRAFPDTAFIYMATFFVWVSVFNLYIVAIFWSVLTDRYSSEQGKRLFGFIAAGGTLGALGASLLVSNFDSRSGNWQLLLLPVVLLELAIWCAARLEHCQTTNPVTKSSDIPSQQDRNGPAVLEPGIWSGFLTVLQSPYLLGIVGFLLLGKWCATTVYMDQVAMVKREVLDVADRQQMFARENWIVQIGTLVFQLGLIRPLIKWIELPLTLALLPIALFVGFFCLAMWPSLEGIFALQIGQRILTYGVLGPAREILFTVVSTAEKYKSKGFIDTAIFRTGDTLASYLHTAISSRLLNYAPACWMIPLCAIWGVLGWRLGVAQRRRAAV